MGGGGGGLVWGYSGFQVTGIIEGFFRVPGFFGVGKCGRYFFGYSKQSVDYPADVMLVLPTCR